MGHKCSYSDKLIWDKTKNQFFRLITAYYKDKSLDVAKVYEDGTIYARNLTFSYIGGYCVDFPGEIVKYRYSSEKHVVEEELFEKIWWKFGLWVGKSNIDKEYIIKNDSSLKYLISKFNGTKNDVLLQIIAAYRMHPEIEPLVEKGQYKLSVDKRLHKLTKEKKAQVINFVKDNLYCTEDMDLNKIFTCIKNNIKYKFYDTLKLCNGDKELLKYLIKQDKQYSFYNDYKKMAIKAGHSFNQEYWKFPKSLEMAHDKVLKECQNIDTALDIILNEQFEIVAKKLKNQEQIINGNHYYIVQNHHDFVEQANALKQCLISSGYMKKFIEQKSILIFIKDVNFKPIGTVEIDYNKKILQAYGNEADRNNCKLPAEIMENVKKYVSHLKICKHKFTFKLPKNCYFKGLYIDDKSFNGVQFEEGKVYSTNYDDETIITTASKCLATDKVYHFCEKITDVKAWVANPNSYAIVEALGPVVQNGTAFGTNKIKIRKITTIKDIATSLLAVNTAVSDAVNY